MPGKKPNNGHTSPNLNLTEQSMAFARAVVYDTKREKTRTQHYRDIFCSTAQDSTVTVIASRLWTSVVLQAYVEELRAEIRERYMVTVESLIEELEEARKVGRETKAASAMVAATMGKAKLAGLDRQIIEHVGDIPVGSVTIEVVSARPENNGN